MTRGDAGRDGGGDVAEETTMLMVAVAGQMFG